MSRLQMTPATPDDPALADVLARLRALKGRDAELPNLYRVLGLSPPMLRAWIDFAWPLRLNARSTRCLRELLILRGAQLCFARYEWAHHVPMALDSGVSVSQIRALENWEEADCFAQQERAVLRVADDVSRGPGASEDCLDQLRGSGFDDEEVVELVLTACFYVCVSRFLSSMAVELEPGFEQFIDNDFCRLPADFSPAA